MRNINSFIAGVLLILCSGCTDSFEDFEAVYGDFEVAIGREVASFDGEINAEALTNLQTALADYATIKTMNIASATGNSNINAAFEMGMLLNSNSITTNISENGSIKKNGLYFYLGGISRSLENGAKIGVSSWQTNNSEEASSLSQDDPAHEPIINYFKEIGFSEQNASDFYFFSLEAAPSTDNYWMTSEEIEQFGLTIQ